MAITILPYLSALCLLAKLVARAGQRLANLADRIDGFADRFDPNADRYSR
jgi:hypothetical protein